MSAACLTLARAARGLALGLVVLVSAAVSATAQSTPASLGVVVDQVLALFPKVDGDLIEVNAPTVTLSIGRKDGVVTGIELSVYREGRELRHPRTGVQVGS